MEIITRTFMFKGEEQTQFIMIADSGKVFTQKQLDEGEERIFSVKIFLSKYDSPDNYIEITEQEAEELQKLEEEDNGES